MRREVLCGQTRSECAEEHVERRGGRRVEVDAVEWRRRGVVLDGDEVHVEPSGGWAGIRRWVLTIARGAKLGGRCGTERVCLEHLERRGRRGREVQRRVPIVGRRCCGCEEAGSAEVGGGRVGVWRLGEWPRRRSCDWGSFDAGGDGEVDVVRDVVGAADVGRWRGWRGIQRVDDVVIADDVAECVEAVELVAEEGGVLGWRGTPAA